MQPGGVTIRRATVDDARQIAEADVASWQAAYRGLLPQDMLDARTVEDRHRGWREILTHEDEPTLVAVSEPSGAVIGFATVSNSRDDDADDGVGELQAIYLHPSRWDTGLGRRLHDGALGLLAGRFTEATLWVLDTNERARRFYERRGWRWHGDTRLDRRGDVVLSEVRYRRALASAD